MPSIGRPDPGSSRILPFRRSSATLAVLGATVAVILAACGDDGATSDDSPQAAASENTAADTGTDQPSPDTEFPLTIDNCGFEITIDGPPERVVTIKSTTTEMMLALGLADRLVGTAFADGPVPDQYADDVADVPVLADQVPGQEALFEVEPDLVFGGWESNFAVDAAGERAALAEFGIDTYVAPSACKEPAYQPDPMTFDALFAHIHQLAQIFDVPDRADEFVAEQKALLDQVDAPGQGLTALWYSSGEDAPYVGGDIGAPAMMMRQLGVENIFADIDDTWSNVSWEEIVDRNPDVLILVDAAWNTAEHKIDLLESNAATAALPAVQEQRYLTLPFPAAEAGVRNAQAVVDLAGQLEELGIEPTQTGAGS
ncbi:putative F420-0 ABC transporter substrate-binding protein [Phytoactinopolyspora halotolerans]|uniref:Putative F420-0 ABC transporter substrate-binding protein n=1 Tax=Phytoactinopolyspora halotolerans TaxID=1981512 RepID=A0A6L9SHT0_9ACTN|nr:putative F420-0 ABC transporter substrate-binding protein [Phytoactinopolyspora halotolerans]NEE03881.1 putative F420-0 ABC transporter substrate-binding protein [Phytoactinopolyspora halotolerans]